MANDEFMLTEAEREGKRRRRRRIQISLVALLLLGGIGFLVARPVRHEIRSWQARRHAEHAFTFIDQQKWSDARDEATAAYRLEATEPQAIRAVGRLLSRAGQGEALEFWKNLREIAPLTREDLRDEARVALRVNDIARADEAARELLGAREGGPSASDWLIAADVQLRKHSFDQAQGLAEKVLASPNASRREQLQANVALDNVARSAGPTSNIDAAKVNERIVALSQGDDDVALEALTFLAARATAAPAESTPPLPIDQLIESINRHPLAKAPHQLLAADLEIAQHRDRRDEIVRRAVEQWKGGNNESLTALAAWLYRNGEQQRLVEAISLDRALQTRELFLQYVDALAALARWDEIRRIIEAERFPLDPVIEHMYLARCFAQQGQENGAENNWQRALEDAAGDLNKLLTLGEYAEKNGVERVATTAFEAAAVANPKSRQAQQGRLRIAYSARDTKRVHSLLEEMLKIWPADTAIQNDEAYIRLLLIIGGTTSLRAVDSSEPEASSSPSPLRAGGSSRRGVVPSGTESEPEAVSSQTPASPSATQSSNSDLLSEPSALPSQRPSSSLSSSSESISSELDAIVKLAEKLVRDEPASLPHRTLLALALLKQNRAQDALSVYANLKVPSNAVSASAVAVHASVLAFTGRKDEARAEIAKIPSNRLLPEEALMVLPLRG
jgi:tetratricopeptide (TPR) repeat protein